MSDEGKLEDLFRAIDAKVRQELRLRCQAYTPDFRTPEVFNVLTALLARQATLAIEMASAPQLWNGHSAPLFLRDDGRPYHPRMDSSRCEDASATVH